SILEELVTEKSQEKNTIDQIIKNQKGVESYSKWCKKYNTTNIDNKKHTCSKCNEKLDTLALRHILFNMIRHTNNESPEEFLNPQDNNRVFKSLEEEYSLSKQLKNFSSLACE
ncbi:24826_t:CDS:2, partial [Racocetra persica]